MFALVLALRRTRPVDFPRPGGSVAHVLVHRLSATGSGAGSGFIHAESEPSTSYMPTKGIKLNSFWGGAVPSGRAEATRPAEALTLLTSADPALAPPLSWVLVEQSAPFGRIALLSNAVPLTVVGVYGSGHDSLVVTDSEDYLEDVEASLRQQQIDFWTAPYLCPTPSFALTVNTDRAVSRWAQWASQSYDPAQRFSIFFNKNITASGSPHVN